MLRTSWTRLAQSSLRSLALRLAQRSSFAGARRSRLRRASDGSSSISAAIEVLERRALLASPVANDDTANVTHGHTLNGSSVLNNDQPNGPGSFVAVLGTGTSHGSLTLHSDGTFVYSAGSSFVGSDSFTYSDLRGGTDSSNTATATINVNNTAPSASNQSYTVYTDDFNSTTLSALSLLNGANDPDGDSLTAVLVTGPAHGTVTVNSNGSFDYVRTAGYNNGADSFVFGVTDGIATVDATASITDISLLGAPTNATDTPIGDYSSYGPFSASQLTGSVKADYALTQGHDLAYASVTADVKPVVAVETTYTQPPAAGNPSSIKLDLTFGGLTASTLYFSNSGLTTGSTLRFADQIDASSLATGHYAYTLTVTSYYGSVASTNTFTGFQDIVNRQGSEFGPGWTLAEKDGLAVQSGGVLWYGGSGGTAWFASNGSGGYTSPAGPLNSSTLTLSGGVYTLTDKLGNTENFSSTGLLTSKVDTNGNTTSYAYSSGKLSTITDQFGRVTTFNYTSGLVTSITDIGGQTTTLGYTSGKLTSITAPVPATGISAPVTSYAYTGNLLTTITDPDSHATSLTYSFAGRISQATFADSSTNQFTPAETVGLVDTSTGTGTSPGNPATPYNVTHTHSVFTNELSNQSTTQFDVFGDVLSSTDPLNLTTTSTFNANGQITQLTQPVPATGVAAPVTGYTYDASMNLTEITYADSSTESWTYGTSGGSLNRPLTHTDQRGKTTTYTYDSHGNVLTMTDALSNVTTMTYNSDGTLASITAPNPSTGGATGGLVTSFTYDSDGRVTRITNPDGTHKDFTYDSEDRLLTSVDELGRTTTMAYDNDGRLTSVTKPVPATGVAAPVINYAYDAASNLTSVTDGMGYVTSLAYNSRNWQTTTTLPPATTGGTSPVITIGYNAAGWKTTETDALGNVTTTVFDADGNVTSVTAPDPDGTGPLSAPVTSYTYDGLGRKISETDPNSHTTDYGYNSLNQQTSATDALGNVTSATYDAMGHVLTITAPVPATGVSAPVTTYTWDSLSRLSTETDPLGNVTTNAYDHDGRLTSVTAPVPATGISAPVTSYTWDSLSRLSTETDPLGNVTTMGYDNAGELTSVTQPVPATGVSAPVTAYAYDGLGREITITDPLSGVTTFHYDANGNMTSVEDSDSNTTSYTFDHLNRLTGETDANSNSSSYSYDLADELTSQTDKDGRVTDYAYDHDGRLTQEQWMSGGTAIYTATYAYNAGSLLTSASDTYSAYAYTYNSDNMPTQVDNNGTPTGPHVVLNIGYDNVQRETSLSATVAGTLDFLNNYSFDANSQLTEITQQGQTGGNTVASKLVNFAFDHDGRLTTLARYANLAATQLVDTGTYGYNADSALTSLSEVKGTTTLASYTWSYDHMGRLTGDTVGSSSDGYTYDAASELLTATHSGGGNESYSYDSNGNRTNTGYSTGTNNQLSSDGTYNYLYDANGNMTKKTTISSGADVTYTWDYRNRLTDVKAYNSSNVLQSHENYVYDVFDRMIERNVDPTGGGTYATKQAIIYGISPPSEGGAGGGGSNVVLVFNGSGALTDRFLNGPGMNNALADENGSGTVSWFLKNREGDTVDVAQYNSTTDTTTVVDHIIYSAFGTITSQTNSAYQPLFAYTGQMWDAAAGLYYYHARWYDPHTGRFISQDPLSFAAGDANLYRYVRNSPTNMIDPTGRDAASSAAAGQANAAAQAQLAAQRAAEQAQLGAQAMRDAEEKAASDEEEVSDEEAAEDDTLQRLIDNMKELAKAEAERAAQIRRWLGTEPPMPGFIGSSDEEWQRYHDEYAQWVQDEMDRNFGTSGGDGWGGLFGGGGPGGLFGGGGDVSSPGGGSFDPGPPPTGSGPSHFPPEENPFEIDAGPFYDPNGRDWGQVGNIYITPGGCGGMQPPPIPPWLQVWINVEHVIPIDEWTVFGGISIKPGKR